MKYLVTFEKAADGSIWAKVPDLDGCFSCGDTFDEAEENIKDAITLYIEDLKAEGQPIPQPNLLKAELVTV
jgi:predicted RNase H-like HicB family nuclease